MWKLNGVSSGRPSFDYGSGFGVGLKAEDVKAIAESPSRVSCRGLLETFRLRARLFMTPSVELGDVDEVRAAAGGEPFTL